MGASASGRSPGPGRSAIVPVPAIEGRLTNGVKAMKLTYLAIEGYGVCRDLRLGRFDAHCNLIVGESGSGKSTLRQFVRGILYGFDPESRLLSDFHSRPVGELELVEEGFRMRITRNNSSGASLHRDILAAPHGHETHPPRIEDRLPSHRIYDLFYSVSFAQSRERLREAVGILLDQFGLPRGSQREPGERYSREWKIQEESLRERWNLALRRRDDLRNQLRDCQARLDQHFRDTERELEQVERELNQLDSAGRDIERIEREHRIRSLQEEIDRLRQKIALETPPERVFSGPSVGDRELALYQRLDEVDFQLRRWIRLQEEIQSQRMELRTAMTAWNELTLDSEAHPYHQAGNLVGRMEQLVELSEQQTARVKAKTKSDSEPHAAASRIQGHCEALRDSIQELCEELGRQYKHVRHRAAVAELKQLRNCFNEVGENIELLQQRRETLLAELNHCDPAGVAAIRRQEAEMVRMAERDGWWAARCKFVGAELATRMVTAAPSPEWVADRERLRLREAELAECIERRVHWEADCRAWEARRDDWVRRREIILERREAVELHRERDQLEGELADAEAMARELEQELLNSPEPTRETHPLLTVLNRWLQEVSGGAMTAAWIDADGEDWIVEDRQGRTVGREVLSRGDQDLVYLSLCLAVAERQALSGIEAPLLLDDLFTHIEANAAQRICRALSEKRHPDLQVLALATRGELATVEREWGGWFELPGKRTSHVTGSLSEERDYPRVFPRPAGARPAPLADGEWLAYPRFGFTAGFGPRSEEARVQESSPVEDLQFIDAATLGRLRSIGIVSVAQLLDLVPADLPDTLRRAGFDETLIDRWQAQAWLMICCPELDWQDVRLLFAAGIREPEQLAAGSVEDLEYRIDRFRDTHDAGRYARVWEAWNEDQLDRWRAALERNRNHWWHPDGASRQRRQWRAQLDAETAQATMRNGRGKHTAPKSPSGYDWVNGVPVPESRVEGLLATERTPARRSAPVPPSKQEDPTLQFHLNLSDSLEAAPSIGPKTAERFAKIGIHTVGEFLKQTAESMCDKLNYKRITVETLHQWQRQSRLVCRVPNLRGHDAQLLVACGITEPEALAVMHAEKLFDLIAPFAKTKEGLRIIRAGKAPTLEEVENWIEWANHMRSLQAA